MSNKKKNSTLVHELSVLNFPAVLTDYQKQQNERWLERREQFWSGFGSEEHNHPQRGNSRAKVCIFGQVTQSSHSPVSAPVQ